METTSILVETGARLRADPAAGQTAPTVTATLESDRAKISSGPFTWAADLALSIGGTNLSPSPTAYLLGALAACGVVFINDTLAPEFGVTIRGITAVARCRADLGGLLGIDGTRPDLTAIQIDITVDTPDPDTVTGPMFDAWERRCPIYLALRNPTAVALRTAVATA